MAVIKNVHHINFIVRDLEAAVLRYEATLKIGPFEYDELVVRGVRTARAWVGNVWLVLVSPTAVDSVPGRYLKRNGEGFFLLSLGVDDLDLALAELDPAGEGIAAEPQRDGLLDWRVVDFPSSLDLGVNLQLTQTKKTNAD